MPCGHSNDRKENRALRCDPEAKQVLKMRYQHITTYRNPVELPPPLPPPLPALGVFHTRGEALIEQAWPSGASASGGPAAAVTHGRRCQLDANPALRGHKKVLYPNADRHRTDALRAGRNLLRVRRAYD